MERKITHYVVKPEHYQHYLQVMSLTPRTELGENGKFYPDSESYRVLTEAKVLEIWAYPVYEKKRITGWLNIYEHTLIKTEHEADEVKGPQRICKVFIDQEIE